MQRDLRSRAQRGFDVFCSFFYVLITAVIAAGVFLIYDFEPEKLVGNGLIPNLVWAVMDAAALLLALRWCSRRALVEDGWLKNGLGILTVSLMSAAILCVQVLITYHIYYMQEHDALNVFETAYYNATGYLQYRDTAYFDIYPNNVFLVAVETLIISAAKLIFGGEPSRERCVLLLVLVQCAINALSGALTALLAQRTARTIGLSGRGAGFAGIAAWLMWLVLVGLSPWFTVIYSDSMSLAFPVLIVWLYAGRGNGKRAVVVSLLIGLLGGIAFRIKPQSSLVLIAVFMVDSAAMLARPGQRKRTAVCLASMLLMVAVVMGPGTRLAQRVARLEPDREKAVSWTHYLAMGLNAETHGFYSPHDLSVSLEAKTSEERMIRNLKTAHERLKAMGIGGFAELMKDKMMINFADGSFYWSDFPIHEVPEKSGLSRTLRDVFYYYGKYQPVLHTAEQGVWILVLLLCPFAALALGQMKTKAGQEQADMLRVMMLTAAGVMTFNMIFESRGRYLFSNVPVLIVLAVAAFCALGQRYRARRAAMQRM